MCHHQEVYLNHEALSHVVSDDSSDACHVHSQYLTTHTRTYSKGRAVRESDTALKSPIDLIMSCTLSRKSPLFYTFSLVYCDPQQVCSNWL